MIRQGRKRSLFVNLRHAYERNKMSIYRYWPITDWMYFKALAFLFLLVFDVTSIKMTTVFLFRSFCMHSNGHSPVYLQDVVKGFATNIIIGQIKYLFSELSWRSNEFINTRFALVLINSELNSSQKLIKQIFHLTNTFVL